MVLMPHPYKDDKQLEEELQETRNGRLMVKRVCSPAHSYEYKEEKYPSADHLRRSLLRRMKMQETQIKYLLETVKLLQDLRPKLEQSIGFEPKIVVVEEISKEEGKTIVEQYFKEHGCADIEEIMLNLRIPVQTIVEIIDELRDEGKLVPQGEKKT